MTKNERPPLPLTKVIPNPHDGSVAVPWDYIVVRDEPQGGREHWIEATQIFVETAIKSRKREKMPDVPVNETPPTVRHTPPERKRRVPM